MLIRLLPRPALPAAPVQIDSWQHPVPPQPLPVRLGPAEQSRLGHALVGLLHPPALPEPPPQSLAPGFVARDGVHPDIGWAFSRLVCGWGRERWATEEDSREIHWEDQELPQPSMIRDRHGLWVHYGVGALFISPDGVEVHGPLDCDLEDPHGHGLALLQAARRLTGLAAYSEDLSRLVYEPVACADCGRHYLLGREDDPGCGCPACGSAHIEIRA